MLSSNLHGCSTRNLRSAPCLRGPRRPSLAPFASSLIDLDQRAASGAMAIYPSTWERGISQKFRLSQRDGHHAMGLSASDDAMTLDDYFRFIVQALRAHCTYSVDRKAWEISGLEAEILFLEYSNRWPSKLASPEDAFQEGERRGFWTRNIDDHCKTDTLVMK